MFDERVPPVSRFFVGRGALVERLLAGVCQRAEDPVVRAICGLGGVGKTSVAAAVAERARATVDIVWWVRAEDPTSLVGDLAGLAPHLGVTEHDDLTDTAGAVRRALAATPRTWLLVFDNAPGQAAIEAWMPRGGSGAVLITSRASDFSLADEVIALETFTPSLAESFLRRRVRATNRVASQEDLRPVVERLGGLPLALEQAGAWAAQVPNRRFARFVQLYDDAASDPFSGRTRPAGYEHTAMSTWRVSVEAAGNAAPLAGRVMAMLAYFAPAETPVDWLRAMGDDGYVDGAGATAIDRALDALHSYALVTITPHDAVTVHRVVQAFSRRVGEPGAPEAAIRCLRRQAPGDARDHRNWPRLARLAPHVLAVAGTASRTAPAAGALLRDLLDDVATYQRRSGAVSDAVTTATTASDLADACLGPLHPDALASRNTLAAAFRSAGDLGRAIPLYESTYADRARVLGVDHPATLASRNDLACAYESAGDLGRAIPLYESTLADRARVLGVDHPATLTSRNHLAGAYAVAGDLERAIPLHEVTAADTERALGRDHPATLASRANLASSYESAGDLGRAIALYESTLADRRRTAGPRHPDTLASRNDLACAYRAAGDLGRAIRLLELTLADREDVLGAEHPDTLTSRNNLACAYETAGDLERAVPLYERTVADSERVLGCDHPGTLTSRNNLAGAYRSAGDLARAVPLYESTLADSERVLGPRHPDTLVSRRNLAGAYVAAGDPVRALPLYRRTLADRERLLGADHPVTLATADDLGTALEAAGDRAQAISLFESTLAGRERVLGPGHPATLTSRNNLAGAYALTGDLRRAIPLYEATLAASERLWGADHPDTRTSRDNLAAARRAALTRPSRP